MQKLYRSRNEKILAGVCGGLGEYFNIDPVFVRILFVVALFSGGLGLIAYIVFWIATPERPLITPSTQNNTNNLVDNEFSVMPEKKETPTRTKLVLGFILIAIGVFIILSELIPNFDLEFILGLVLIGLGLFLLLANKHKDIYEQ